MFYVLLAASLLGAAGIQYAINGFSTLACLWQFPLLTAGMMVGLVLLFLLAGELLLLLVSLFQPEIGPALLVLVPGIVLFLNSILLPVAFKLGVEKSRYITVAIMLLPTLVLLLMEKLGVQPPQLSARLLALLPLLLLAFSVLLFYLSGLLSCRLYRGREF